ncbi:transglycosylase domain-containing protein [Solwaraspora sp. WMMD791]|uniref:transglycosylase domain-containing protein n=1 Tax=Solwaraspora sp. WMMD791 TaxID=3016086 RepID=UPI00249C3FA9|nr:transglycosylase domain-containing protein [Solwaraspora sp. WMMD791]WFE27519.1 transglycosylase domain-containing protein [Solwaraspora sp. WMMD791]
MDDQRCDDKDIGRWASQTGRHRRTARYRATDRKLALLWRRNRWWRVLCRTTGVLVTGAIAAGIAVAVYVHSVDLPADPVEPQASTLYYSDGQTVLARIGVTSRTDAPLDEVPEPVRRIVLAAEDRAFYTHSGVSIRGVLRALVANVEGRREGASTITQQYARNAFLTQDVSLDRKAREFAMAIKLERRHSKDEILERYLNTIYFGRGAYGITAAAHAYFRVPTRELTAAQGAVLAAVIKDPYGFDPANDAEAARDRWDWVIGAARDAGWLADTPEYPPVQPPSMLHIGPNGIVLDQVEQELSRRGVAATSLYTAGLSVVTTLDAAAQPAALAQIEAHLDGQPENLRAALVAVDPGSGAVRAYYGSQEQGQYDFAVAPRPPAATFAPVVLALATLHGFGPNSRWDGTSPQNFPGRLGVPLYNRDDIQCPDCTLEQAMMESLSTPFYAVTEKIGAEQVRELAYQLGVPQRYGDHRALVDVEGEPLPGETRSDISIGRYPVAPVDLATVYGTFASGGVRYERHFIESVAAATGASLLTNSAREGRPVLPPLPARMVNRTLAVTLLRNGHSPGRPAAGKTGNQLWADTSDYQDAWMAGYTAELATVVWIGGAEPGPLRDRDDNRIEGSSMPAAIWRDFTRDALAGHPVQQLPGMGAAGRPE